MYTLQELFCQHLLPVINNHIKYSNQRKSTVWIVKLLFFWFLKYINRREKNTNSSWLLFLWEKFLSKNLVNSVAVIVLILINGA